MMERLQIVPAWTYFNLNNGTRLDLMIDVKGLEESGFDECLEQASQADSWGNCTISSYQSSYCF
jgi:hypothetical protein